MMYYYLKFRKKNIQDLKLYPTELLPDMTVELMICLQYQYNVSLFLDLAYLIIQSMIIFRNYIH
jgi:hypothetical protein